MWKKVANKSRILARNWQKYLFLLSSWSCMGHSSSAHMTSPTILPKKRHTATVIFLHGLGDTGHGWCEMFDQIKNDYTKYIFPNAPNSPVTLNAGMVMPSWFDIRSLSFDAKEDEAGIKSSSSQVLKLVESEEKGGIKPERICVGGFSQGGAVALHAGLTSGKPFGCIVGLSTFLPLHQQIGTTKSEIPMLLCHGDSDPVVNLRYGVMTSQVLGQGCPNVIFKKYGGLGHASNPQEISDVAKFLSERLPPID